MTKRSNTRKKLSFFRRFQKESTRSVFVDIRKPGFDYGHIAHYPTIDIRKELNPLSRTKSLPEKILEKILLYFIVIAALGALFLLISYVEKKGLISSSLDRITGSFNTIGKAIQEGRYDEATQITKENTGNIETLQEAYDKGQGPTLSNIFGFFIPKIKEAASLISLSAALNADLFDYATNINLLGANYVVNLLTDNKVLLDELQAAKNSSRTIITTYEQVRNKAQVLQDLGMESAELDAFLKDSYLRQVTSLHGWNAFLEVLDNQLAKNNGLRIVLVYYNEKQVRAGGGEVDGITIIETKQNGEPSISTFDASAIKADKNFSLAPRELSVKNAAWSTKDMLWFDDAYKSARAIESALIFATSTVNIKNADLTVLINRKTLYELFDLLNKNPLEKTTILISSSTYELAVEKQRKGQVLKVGSESVYPGKIIEALFKALQTEKALLKKDVPALLSVKLKTGDIAVTSGLNELETIFSDLGSQNKTYTAEENFFGTFLSPRINQLEPNTDISKVTFNLASEVHIDVDGSVLLNASMRGTAESAAKYRYQVILITNPDSELVSVKGNENAALPRYQPGIYYSELDRFEERRISLPDHFAWIYDSIGKTSIGAYSRSLLEKPLEYRVFMPGRIKKPLSPGDKFTYHISPQRGVVTVHEGRVYAPIGFHFEESGSPVYIIKPEVLSAPKSISLTLTK